jgi:hypothetical protein
MWSIQINNVSNARNQIDRISGIDENYGVQYANAPATLNTVTGDETYPAESTTSYNQYRSDSPDIWDGVGKLQTPEMSYKPYEKEIASVVSSPSYPQQRSYKSEESRQIGRAHHGKMSYSAHEFLKAYRSHRDEDLEE